jgi:hypothetical protein
MKTKVEQMGSPKTGLKVANQFIITSPEGIFFQSYNSIIVKRSKGKTYLDEYYWNISKTTGKYRNIFLGEKTAETMAKIKSGEYILTNLN